jgi:hypothetical protein
MRWRESTSSGSAIESADRREYRVCRDGRELVDRRLEHCDEFEACTERSEVLAKRGNANVLGMLEWSVDANVRLRMGGFN